MEREPSEMTQFPNQQARSRQNANQEISDTNKMQKAVRSRYVPPFLLPTTQRSGVIEAKQATGKIVEWLKPYLWAPSMNSTAPDLGAKDILIGVMGMTGVGKTSFIKEITGLDLDIGHDLESCKLITPYL